MAFSPRPCCRSSVRPYASVPFPQRQRFPRFGAVAAWLSSPRPFCRPSARPCPSVPFPQRQRFPRFGAVAVLFFSPHPFCRPSAQPCLSVPFPQRQQISQFGAVAESHSSRPLAAGSLNGIVYQNPFHHSRSFTSHHTPYPPFSLHPLLTFRRCAEFRHFRLTFRRCEETSLRRERSVSVFLLPPCISHLSKVRRIPAFSSHLPKVRNFKMEGPDALCRKTSIVVTRILVFLPLLNRK